jgi:hypothetical protein
MLGRKRNHLRRLVTSVAVGALLPACWLLTTSPVAVGAATTAGYTVQGNEIVAPNGSQFIPYGFVVYCLSESAWQTCNAESPTDTAKIEAAANFWHANTVRIQVAYENLYSGDTVNTTFVSDLDSEVATANSLGMVAIITLQTERYNGSLMPAENDSYNGTPENSVKFWKYMSKHYAKNPMVFFDLFNEPRLKEADFVGGTEDEIWNIWQAGGTVSLTSAGVTTQHQGL